LPAVNHADLGARDREPGRESPEIGDRRNSATFSGGVPGMIRPDTWMPCSSS
jgi:hypothetical protein